jgi:hypothetical protein
MVVEVPRMAERETKAHLDRIGCASFSISPNCSDDRKQARETNKVEAQVQSVDSTHGPEPLVAWSDCQLSSGTGGIGRISNERTMLAHCTDAAQWPNAAFQSGAVSILAATDGTLSRYPGNPV